MVRYPYGDCPNLMYFRCASGGVKAGQLLKTSSGEVTPIANGDQSAATLVGLALEAGAEDVAVPVIPFTGNVFEIDYLTSATKKTFTDADLANSYDVNINGTTGEQTLDLDDVTGGWLVLVGYDNDRKVARVITTAARLLYSN